MRELGLVLFWILLADAFSYVLLGLLILGLAVVTDDASAKPRLDLDCVVRYIEHYDPALGQDADWVLGKFRANCVG